ncbi:hypothetical protein UlMin_024924 [Ulmus minor]
MLKLKMAHLLRSYPNISTKLSSETSCKRARTSNLIACKESHFGYLERRRKFVVQSCSNSISSAEEVGLTENGRGANAIKGETKTEFEYLVSEYGWKVRRLGKHGEEIREAALVQAEAFHEPVALFNDLFYEFFRAEVMSGLVYKLRNSPPNRYACLVAEGESDSSNTRQELVGVVDVTVLRDQNVLRHLPPDAEEYLYVSGIAVLKSFRRKKIATVLLKACDMLSIVWGFRYLALRAYEDDYGARQLYANAGYRVVSGDPPWLTTWIGRKRRVLMIKHSNNLPTDS